MPANFFGSLAFSIENHGFADRSRERGAFVGSGLSAAR